MLADIEVPRQFSAVEDLADEAGENMTEAARLYREAYADEAYNENEMCIRDRPKYMGCSVGITPIPIMVETTGMRNFSENFRSSSQAPLRVTPPPA